MNELRGRLGDRLIVESIGAFESGSCTLGDRVGLPRRRDYASYVSWLRRRATWDVAVLPARRDPERASDFRALELASLGLPIVCARSHPESEWISSEGVGVVVDDTEGAWSAALSSFVHDATVRSSVATAALAAAERRREQAEAEWTAWLDAVVSAPRRVDVPLRVSHRVLGLESLVRSAPDASGVMPARSRSSFSAELEPGRSKTRRKIEKLIRDPERFFADSRSPWIRVVGGVVGRLPKRR